MTIKIAENLHTLRKEKGITQEELAAVFSVTPQSVSKWELGISCPDITMLPKLAEYYQVSVDELLGYKPTSSINSIYIQIQSLLSSIKDDGELIDAVYRICRLTGACTSKRNTNTVPNLIEGKYGNNASILLTYGKEHGGVLIHNINSMLVSSFKDMPKIDLAEIRELYRSLSSFCNVNALKVMVALFENNNNSNIKNGMTVEELSNATSLTTEQVYEAMNHLDIQINENLKEERWVLKHLDTVPLLLLLKQGREFF